MRQTDEVVAQQSRSSSIFARCSAKALAILFIGILSGCGGGSDSPRDDQPGQDGPPALFTATRQLITEGETTLLRWESSTADSVAIEPGIGAVETSGERSIAPSETTEYVLEARLDNTVTTIPLIVTVRPLAAVTLLSSAVEGDAPLTVRLTPEVNSSTAINRLYWDFEGDGGDIDGGLGVGNLGFDRIPGVGDVDVVGRELTYTFDQPGTYSPRVRVWDVAENQAESTITINVLNAPPVAQVRVSPTTGTAPLNASFTVNATDNEGIASYDWDFDGDGNYDETSSSGRISHRYETVGEFKPFIRVTDQLGASTVLDPLHLQVNARLETVPAVTVTPFPDEGVAPLSVSFRASARSSSPIASWAWDFNGDGQTDSNSPSNSEFVYTRIGTYYPTLTVTAEDGSVGRDIFSVRVEADPELTIVNPAIDPESGQTAEVKLTLNGGAETELVIEGAAGTARTLASWADRDAGDYTFAWDGKDDTGLVAAPGPYHAVLRYRMDDVEKVLDLRTTTGGLVFYPSGWGGGCRYTETRECGVLTISENAIQPFADSPAVYDFTTPFNARMTAYVTVIGTVDFAPATFFRSRPMAMGNYSIEWFGEGTDGRLLPLRDRQGYLPAIYGTTASDNAIYLNHEAQLSALGAEPPIFYPPLSTDGAARSRLTFDLNRDANLILTIDSVDVGAEVFRREYADIAAGSSRTLEWDGRNADGNLVAPGGYRISLTAFDRYGRQSLPVRAMQRVRY